MIKSLIRLVIIAVAGILIYNYFLGSDSEKETSQKIFQEVKDVGSSVADLIRNEKDKFDAGKYDSALDKIGGLFDNLRSDKADLDENVDEELSDLEKERRELEDRLAELEKEGADEDGKEMNELKDDLDKFMDRTKTMIDLIQGGN